MMSKFKASAEDKFGVAEIMEFVFEWVKNIVGKGENAGHQHFLLFLQCSQKASYPGSLKGWLVVFGFNATLRGKVISRRSVTHICFLAFSHQY